MMVGLWRADTEHLCESLESLLDVSDDDRRPTKPWSRSRQYLHLTVDPRRCGHSFVGGYKHDPKKFSECDIGGIVDGEVFS